MAVLRRRFRARNAALRMIDPSVLNRVRNGVCAVGYLTVPLGDYVKYYELPGMFKVVGTGFLVRDTTVITNGHVIDDLRSEQGKEYIPDTQLFLSFVVPRRNGPLGITVRLIRHTGFVRNGRIDIGFIEFEIVHPEHFQDIAPLAIDEAFGLEVSEHIGAFGYPHGSTLSEKDGRLRWGPVLQQGWVSGVSPYEGSGTVDEVLLDLRAEEGMSGSPIFRPSTGSAAGILHSGIRAKSSDERFGTTTAFGQPLDRSTLWKWLAEYDLERGF